MSEYNTLSKVNDIVGFFTQYQTNKPDHFAVLFPNVTNDDISALNYLLSDVYGDRIITESYNRVFENNGAESCVNRIVSAVDMLFFEQWKQLKTTIENALKTDVKKPLIETKTINETREGNTSDNEQNKTNAFDDTLNPSDTDSSEHTSERADTIERTETTEKSNGKTPAENATVVIDFARNNDYLNIILNDIVSHCTISVFG